MPPRRDFNGCSEDEAHLCFYERIQRSCESKPSSRSRAVENIVYKKGQFLNASLDKASDKNERSSLVINSDGGVKIIVVQIAGLIARRILGFISANHNLEQGERFGLIRFGSRVDIYMPLDAVTQCVIGDTVIAGESVLASLN